MTLVIGTDEAGYGPNLGPLVIAATAWQVDAPPARAETVVEEAVSHALASVETPIIWRDSKEVYRGGAGRDLLLHSALAAIGLAHGRVPAGWQELAAMLHHIAPGDGDASPEWRALASVSLLEGEGAKAVTAAATQLTEQLAAHGVRLCSIRCRCLYPGTFNRLIDSGLNKSDILSRETLALAAGLATELGTADAPTLIWCDRHGGRKRYAGVIAAAFGTQAEPLEETPHCSAYRLGGGGLFAGPPATETILEFSVQGERRPPVAVASLTAKSIRELTMEQFNRFWCDQQPNLAPTAGYPVDAARWRDEATPALERLGIDPAQVWRQV